MCTTLRTISLAATAAVALAGAATLAMGAAPAVASSCAHAHARPEAIGTKRAGRAVACLLDHRRRAHGLGPLDGNKHLRRAARAHSRRMDGHGCFDHICPGEPDPLARLRQAGYLLSGLLSWGCGENIGWGEDHYGTPASIVRSWMNSPPHRANLLNGHFQDVGVGVAWGTPSNGHGGGGLYTADFGYRHR